MIDYLTLLLVNMVAGFFILASYLLSGASEVAARKWAAPFGVVALVAPAGGLYMSFTWTLIGSYNIAFGEMSVLFGAFFAGTALALAMEWNPSPMGFYGVFSGLAANHRMSLRGRRAYSLPRDWLDILVPRALRPDGTPERVSI